jgi:hypothetical protein
MLTGFFCAMPKRKSKSKDNGKLAMRKRSQSTALNGDSSGFMHTMFGNRVNYGLMTKIQEEAYVNEADFKKTDRTDYGRAIDITIPQGYHGQAKKSWEMYGTDRFFRYLVDRSIDYGANGFEWHLPMEDPSSIIPPPQDPTKPPAEKKEKVIPKELKQIELEQKFWEDWGDTINSNTSNIIPGIDEINKWIFKQLFLGGMAPLEWEWGKIDVDGESYNVPIRMTTHNVLSTALERKNEIFLNERVHIKISPTKGKNVREQETVNQVRGTSTATSHFDPNSWHTMNLLGRPTPGRPSKAQGFVIKYNWSPGDNTSTIHGTAVTTGQGLYPQPPFYGLDQVLILRRQLTAADIAILDGVINYIVDWSIGDDAKDADGVLVHEPKPARYNSEGVKIEKSTIESVAEMITSENRGNVMQLFHPYYYKLSIIMPDINLLVSNDKYTHSTVEMYAAFGIFLSITDRRVDFTDINTANFEQILDNVRRRHIARFWKALCTEIVKRNEGKLESIPNMVFNPLNTEDQTFRDGLLALAKVGKVSLDSLLKGHKLDKRTELVRIAKEVSSGEKDVMDANVPVSFVQSTVNPEGSKEDNSRSSTQDGGRPKKGQEEEED